MFSETANRRSIMHFRTLRYAGSAVILASVFAASAQAALFRPVFDEFWITKNTAGEIFRDSFEDGVLPPSGPDDPVLNPTYLTGGSDAGFVSEANGKLTVDPSLGTTTLITSFSADKFVGATRRRSADPLSSAFLGEADTFSINAIIDLSVLPMAFGELVGIRMTDRDLTLANFGNDVIQLSLSSSTIGEVGIRLVELDFASNTGDVVSFVSIAALLAANPAADQIRLSLTKDVGTDAIGASFELLTGGSGLGTMSLTTFSTAQNDVLRIYDGEAFTRAQFFATTTVPVSEPAGVALFALGVAGLGMAALRGRTHIRPNFLA